MDDRHAAVFVKFLKTSHMSVEPVIPINLAQAAFFQTQLWAQLIIIIITKRHDSIKPIITAGKFKHNKDTVFRKHLAGEGKATHKRCQKPVCPPISTKPQKVAALRIKAVFVLHISLRKCEPKILGRSAPNSADIQEGS